MYELERGRLHRWWSRTILFFCVSESHLFGCLLKKNDPQQFGNFCKSFISRGHSSYVRLWRLHNCPNTIELLKENRNVVRPLITNLYVMYYAKCTVRVHAICGVNNALRARCPSQLTIVLQICQNKKRKFLLLSTLRCCDRHCQPSPLTIAFLPISTYCETSVRCISDNPPKCE